MKNLKDVAKSSVSLGRIMSERNNKLETADIIKYHPDGVTINYFEKVIIGDEEVYVYTVREEESGFIFAGFVLKKMFNAIIEEYGDYEKALKAIQEEGLSVKLSRTKTKDGKRELTKVEVL